MQTGCEAPSFWPCRPRRPFFSLAARAVPLPGASCAARLFAIARRRAASVRLSLPAAQRRLAPRCRCCARSFPCPPFRRRCSRWAVSPSRFCAPGCPTRPHRVFCPSPQVQPSPFSRPALPPLWAPSRQSLPPPPCPPFPACPCRPQRTGGGETACGEGRGDWRGPLPPALSLLLAPAPLPPACRRQGFQPVALPFQPGPPLAASSRALAADARSGSPKSQTGRCPSPSRAPAAGAGERGAKKKTPFSLWEKEVL